MLLSEINKKYKKKTHQIPYQEYAIELNLNMIYVIFKTERCEAITNVFRSL